MPFPDSESPEEGDTALGRDALGEDRKGMDGLGEGGTYVKVEESSNTSSADVEAKNNPNARSHVPEMDEYEERNSSEGDDATVSEGMGSELKYSKEIPKNTRAMKGWKGMDKKEEAEDVKDMDIKSNDRGSFAERGHGGDNDQDWDDSEERCSGEELEKGGREEDASVRDILDKYLPILERGGAGVDQREGKCGGGQEVENNRNHNQGELEGGDQSAEMVVNQVDQVDEEDLGEEKIEEDGSTEMVIDQGDISVDKAADEDAQLMAGRENIQEKSEDGSMVSVIDKEDTGEEKSVDESYCEGGARMSNAGKGEDPGGILTNLVFGNFDSKGRLEDNILEEETLQHLGNLTPMLEDAALFPFVDDIDHELKEGTGEEGDFSEKVDGAEDFFHISEMLDDASSSEPEDEEVATTNGNIALSPTHSGLAANDCKGVSNEEPSSLPPQQHSASPPLKTAPLASLRPERYKNANVKDFFPAFKENAPLRFSELFPVKESLKPSIWKRLRKRKAKEEHSGEDEGLAEKIKRKGWVKDYAPIEDFVLAQCDSVRFHQPAGKTRKVGEREQRAKKSSVRKGPKPTDWRSGPAQFWYDMLELPEECPGYDYGLKVARKEGGALEPGNPAGSVRKNTSTEASNVVGEIKVEVGLPQPTRSGNCSGKIEYPPDAFHMVTQLRWEDDIIWNGEEVRQKVLSKLNSKSNAAGWVPSTASRTANSFSQRTGVIRPELQIRLATMGKKLPQNYDNTWYSIFPVENEELAYGRWEDEVIWDAENMPKKLEPRMVSLDPNDENIVISIPDDIDPTTLPNEEPTRKIKIVKKHVKESKLLLNRAGIISVVEEESSSPSKSDNRDPFYVGNDEFYMRKEPATKVATGGTLLQHATPNVKLQAPFIPTHLGVIRLRQFHRWPIKRYSHGPLSQYTAFHGVQSLFKHQKKMEKWRTAEREEAGGGDIFLMREARDLSGKDGDLVLMEFCEEYPPLISFVGMCSKIKNYYKRKPDRIVEGQGPKELKFGELTFVHNSPFLGTMAPGQTMQAVENNMFRSPIYEHKLPNTDFLVIRTRTEFSIREVSAFFVAGQQCPLYEVPGPNSKRSNNFARDFLQVFIYRLFQESHERPKRIKMDDIKKAFPNHSESTIRKRLKLCAQFYRTGSNSNWWVMRSTFRLPSEEEIRSMVDPELCAAFYSMAAAEQRLKDSGYGDKFILAQEEEDIDELKMDDEIKCAPWHTSRAYVQATKGKCLMQLTGPADPTGPAQEGFSYAMIPNKPVNKEEQEAQPKKMVNGTDADLRKLPLKDAKAILRKSGVPEEEIRKLSRWEVIDVVRTLSTEKVKAGEEGADSFKFSRGNRFSIAEHQERYKEDCQRIFEVQNKVLASNEVLSSDEAESSSDDDEGEEEDLDEMGRNIEKMLANKKTSNQFLMEREEAERQKLHKDMMNSKGDSAEDKGRSDGVESSQVLRITRTFRNQQGREFTRTELVRKAMVIETYVKVRNTKDDTFIRQFASMDDQVKEEMKKEKRRIQEQLRRIKKNQEKERLGIQRKKKEKMKPDLKLKCGACGNVGHMKTNKACSHFQGEDVLEPQSVVLAMEDEERLKFAVDNNTGESLVNVEGTKVTISDKILKQTEEVQRRGVQLKIGKEELIIGKRPRPESSETHCDYLDKRSFQPTKRRRSDPMVTFSIYLESILQELRSLPEAEAFLFPVNMKAFPKYHEVVKTPMDLQTIRAKVQEKRFSSREEFLSDINQIVENARLFNGENSILAINSKVLLDIVVQAFTKAEEQLMSLEKAINPLLDDNDQTALSYILQNILSEKIMSMQEARPFLKPLDKSRFKDLYGKIEQPMDLETVSRKVASHKYQSRQEFIRDIELIYQTSVVINGEMSELTQMGRVMVDTVLDTLVPFAEHCSSLEANIRDGKKRSLGTIRAGGGASMNLSQSCNETGVPAEKLLYSSLEEGDDDWDEVEERAEEQSKTQDLFSSFDQKVLVQALDLSGRELDTSGRQKGSQAVDENYDPTDFLQSFGPGEILGTTPLPMVLHDGTVIKAEPEDSSETRLKDDLAVSDDSEDGLEDDPMAF